MKIDKEFKEALSLLPSSEKDKLILRLLRKDVPLANRLYFELIDDQSVEERRSLMEESVISKVKIMSESFYSPGYLMMDMRYLSGEITEHVNITKDKFGDPYLNLLMLNNVLQQNNSLIINSSMGKSYKICIYIVSKVFKIMILIKKLHEDFQMEFNEDLIKLGNLISKNDHIMNTSISNGLDVNWLLSAEIPEDIEEIQKEIRKNGFLR